MQAIHFWRRWAHLGNKKELLIWNWASICVASASSFWLLHQQALMSQIALHSQHSTSSPNFTTPIPYSDSDNDLLPVNLCTPQLLFRILLNYRQGSGKFSFALFSPITQTSYRTYLNAWNLIKIFIFIHVQEISIQILVHSLSCYVGSFLLDNFSKCCSE